ncbi:MAG TPA: ribulose-phosphate 3-epimerase [Verrucomicrobiaceae bacterium]|jgi:ribulose-phosphate 3-epimerase
MDFRSPLIIPSLLAADFAHVAAEVRRAEDSGAKWLHLDVMDGNFVDNISFGPAMIAAVRKQTSMFLDVHLMIHRADHYLDRFLKSGADNISIHVEAKYDSDVKTTLERIKSAGRSAGIVINPATPFESSTPYLSLVDLLLVMTVVPGFGGQPFMEKETMPKLQKARDWRESQKLKYHLEVDGGIYANTAPIARKHGANLFVCGTSSFGPPDMKQAVAELSASVQP